MTTITRRTLRAACVTALLVTAPFTIGPLSIAAPSAAAQASAKWYEGGTLAKGSGLDWQQATTANKLATCADLLAVTWKNKKLKPEIMNTLRNIDDFRPWAALLAAELDAAFEADPDPEQNKKMFSNQDVATMAVMIMMVNGWLEN